MTDWQPMDTAPLDGTRVRLWIDGGKRMIGDHAKGNRRGLWLDARETVGRWITPDALKSREARACPRRQYFFAKDGGYWGEARKTTPLLGKPAYWQPLATALANLKDRTDG